jgi:hypothetical protein
MSVGRQALEFWKDVILTTMSNPKGLSFFSNSHWELGSFLSNSIISSPAPSCCAICVLTPLLEAITTLTAPFNLRSWARIRPGNRPQSNVTTTLRQSPVGPAPKISTSTPAVGPSMSTPWIAQDVGSTNVASSSVKLLILKTFLLWLYALYFMARDTWPTKQLTPRRNRRNRRAS